jgi:hypothetical protein
VADQCVHGTPLHARCRACEASDVEPIVFGGAMAKDYSGFAQRVEQERSELCDKLMKLSAFLQTESFKALPVNEQVRLKHQQLLMTGLEEVLRHRINNNFQ